jgi:hypothetical protein
MKLIAEYNEHNLECLVEKKEDGTKKYAIEGVFMMAESKNRNGRIYPKKIMEKAVDEYVEKQVSKSRAVGELNHPEGPTVNLDKVSHLITDLQWEGNDVVGKATILDTPMGQIVKGLLEGGVNLGVSTRGMGSLEQRGGAMYVKEDFTLSTVDIVQDPSAPNAFVNGIMEGVESLQLKRYVKIQKRLNSMMLPLSWLVTMPPRRVSLRISSHHLRKTYDQGDDYVRLRRRQPR